MTGVEVSQALELAVVEDSLGETLGFNVFCLAVGRRDDSILSGQILEPPNAGVRASFEQRLHLGDVLATEDAAGETQLARH